MGLDPTLITNALANWQRPADPLAAYAKLQALKNGVVQQQAAQQQLQSGALDLQEKQKAVQDQQALSDAFKASYAPDPTTGKLTLDENALYRNMSTGGLGAKIPAVQKSIQDANESAVKFKQTQTAANEAAQDYLGQQLLYVKDAKYDPATFTATLGAAVSHGAIPAAEAAQLTQRLQQNPTAEGVQALVDPLITASKTSQDILTKRATAAKDTAEGNKAAADEQRTKDQDFKNAYGNAGSPQAAAQIWEQAHATGVSPGVMAGAPPPASWTPDAGQAFASQTLTEKDVAEIKQRKADAAATAANRAQTLAQGQQNIDLARGRLGVEQQRFKAETGAQGNEALANVPLNQRNAALADALKVGNEAATASHAADEMNDLINLARSGNKVAYAYSPVTGVLTINSANGSKRVNLNEIRAYEGAGSAVDAIKEAFMKQATGASIDSSVLDDMAQVHNKLAATAQDMYKRKLDVVNQTYKSNFAAVPFASAPAAAAPGGSAPAAPAPVVNAAPGFTPTRTPAPAPAVMPDWKKAAAAAKVGDVVPIPGGKRVLKTGANSFQPLP